ncbi:MAG: DegT/DnrJ/EryC1/StrS family aminotransferase [Patescibacteria group bacterium]|nr:DegT/DnrJ/EryC1/StrS family aminotransferase [Patescibacteria group bacterium]
MNPFKPISISLSPNTEKDDILLALKMVFQPNKWKKGKAIKELENKFKEYFNTEYAFSFNSGRSSLIAILDALEIKENDVIFIQAFTCNAAVNPILQKKAKPIFVDIDETLNLDPKNLEQKIISERNKGKTLKAIMVQHTFGHPAQVDKIIEIAQKNNLILIEDCAHSLGAKYKGKLCGTFGDISFFSFGRDKIISSVFGGITTTNNTNFAKKLAEFQQKIKHPSSYWILQQLMHPILMNCFILPCYSISGKYFLFLFQKIKILSKAVYWKEKRGEMPIYFPKQMPNVLAILALNQFKKLNRLNEHRRKISKFYEKNLKELGKFNLIFKSEQEDREVIFMKYPVLIKDSDYVIEQAKNENIMLDDGWRKSTIVPPDTKREKMEYIEMSCPKAERVAQNILNLPTHINISIKDAQKIVSFINNLK